MKNFKIFFTTLDKSVQGKTISFVIFRFNCHKSAVIVIGNVSKMSLVRLAEELKEKPASTSRGFSRNSRKVHVSKGTMESPRICQKTKNERKDAMNSNGRNLKPNEMERSSGCYFMWEDPNVALHNDTNFGAEGSIFFALNYRHGKWKKLYIKVSK